MTQHTPTQTQHTAGAIRAADLIIHDIQWTNMPIFQISLETIIDNETHAAEMLAFILKVESTDLANHIQEIQQEAFELIKKVRG